MYHSLQYGWIDFQSQYYYKALTGFTFALWRLVGRVCLRYILTGRAHHIFGDGTYHEARDPQKHMLSPTWNSCETESVHKSVTTL